MATQIATSTYADATGPSASPLVVFAPSDNSAIVLWHDGTAPKLSTAQSPYTTWSTQTIGSATSRHFGGLRVNSDDSVDVVICSPSNGAFWFGFTRSGNSWSSSTNGNVGFGNTFTTGNADAAQLHKDSQGRLWWVQIDPATPTLVAGYSSAPATSWTSSLSQTTLQNHRGAVFSAIIGNYLVVVYGTSSGHLSYQRVDVSGASVGSWSSAAAISGITDEASTIQGDLVSFDTSKGMLVYSSANGIKAYTYDSSTDTWASSATLSASSSDLQPSLVAGAAGTVYAIWAQNSSGSNYALVSKAYSGGSWDSSATSLETTAAGQSYPHAAYLSSSDKFGLLFTSGTSSPFGVKFDLVSAPTTGGATTNTRTVTTALAAQTTSTRTVGTSLSAQTTSTRTVATSIATQTTQARTVSTAIATETTNERTVSASLAASTTSERTVTAAIATQTTSERTVPTALAVSTSGAVRTAPAAIATQVTAERTVTTSLAAQTESTRTVGTSLAIQTTGIRTVPTAIAVSATVRTVPTALSAQVTRTRTVPTALAVSAAVVFGRATATDSAATTATATATDATTATATVAAATTATATLSTR